MKIGILQAGHVLDTLAAKHGEYSDIFERFLAGKGFTFHTWNVVDDEFPANPSAADGWLITGSRHSVYENRSWIRQLERFLRECYANDIPIVGVCFGHQVLATALGGTVELSRRGWTIGRQEYLIGSESHHLNCWHQDEVTSLPDSAKRIGTSKSCRNAMLAYGNRAISMQPHPEFGHAFLDALIEARGVGVMPDHVIEQARNELGKVIATDKFAEIISGFFLKSRRSQKVAKPRQGDTASCQS